MSNPKILNKKTKKGKIFIISGPSGSGKTTLHDMLLADKEVKKYLAITVSATTRQPRKGEKHGKDYFFLSEKMFNYKIKAKHFLEYAQVFNNYYGTPRIQVNNILRQGKNVLLSIDVQGCRQICEIYPDAITIFIKTSSLAVLKKRLEARKTEDAKTRKMRLETAREELRQAGFYKYFIINDNLMEAYLRLKTTILHYLRKV